MEFSVITACGDRDQQRINDLAASLAHQTEQDFEWVVACRNPRALSRDVARRAHVVAIDQQTAGGALRQAVRQARGGYIVFADADDYLKPDTLAEVAGMVRKDSGVGVDLNPYPTYEPCSSFMKLVRLKHLDSRAMPDYGGPSRADVNQARRNGTLTRPQLLKAAHSQRDRFARQVQLIGKAVPNHLAQRLCHWIDPDNRLYPNLAFEVRLLQAVKRYRRLNDFYYVQVLHNDMINDPSLSQVRDPQRWPLYLKAVSRALKSLRSAPRLRERLAVDFLSHVTRSYKSILHHNSDTVFSLPHDLRPFFNQLANLLNQLDRSAFGSLNGLNRHVIKLLMARRFKKARHSMKTVMKLRYWHRIIHQHGRGITKYLYFTRYLKRPVNPKVILFESFLGRNFSDSPKYVYLYLQKHAANHYRYVWVADAQHLNQIRNDVKNFINTTVVPRFGFGYMKYLATAKYFVLNMRQPKWFIKRPGMRFVETWHGTPLKHLVFDMKNVASASVHYKATFYHQSRQWDRLVVDNPFSYRVFKHAFMYPQLRMIKSGYPRNDLLYAPNRAQIARQVKKKLGIPLDKKVILYAPTWRDNEFVSHGHYHFRLTLNVRLLQRYLDRDYVLVLRTHYFITNHLQTAQFGNFVYDASNYDDISQLYLIADVLITDYSSVFFDYANLKRPILFYVYDYDTYARVLRGFYLNMERDLPGPLLKTSAGVLRAIQNLSQVKSRYHERYRRFNQRFNVWDDGHASARVAKALLK